MRQRGFGVARVGRLHRRQRKGDQHRQRHHELPGDDAGLRKQPLQAAQRPLARQQQVQQHADVDPEKTIRRDPDVVGNP
jgi:hypothetical protein